MKFNILILTTATLLWTGMVFATDPVEETTDCPFVVGCVTDTESYASGSYDIGVWSPAGQWLDPTGSAELSVDAQSYVDPINLEQVSVTTSSFTSTIEADRAIVWQDAEFESYTTAENLLATTEAGTSGELDSTAYGTGIEITNTLTADAIALVNPEITLSQASIEATSNVVVETGGFNISVDLGSFATVDR